MIPGSNLYRQARRLIGGSPVVYFKYAGRTQNSVRQYVSTFDAGVQVKASVQAVPRSKYTFLGLDFQRNYVNIFIDKNAIDLQRDAGGDQFVYDGFVFQLEGNTQWFEQDGWVEGLAVQIGRGNAPIPATQATP
ncbi:hypothetical protein PLUTO_00160 [Luteibacter phage vB_LflM-Pluto]|uniref:Uncharacterized protein n=1 Tax=Luteibacter phage vB_LflM-Pluto TaxID=2948611 RepID=A0A9E7SN56_9CAUD|nr:hypothetical protein PLUTO_00160 [Luteibacter phage vB_LflM-Pluto]